MSNEVKEKLEELFKIAVKIEDVQAGLAVVDHIIASQTLDNNGGG